MSYPFDFSAVQRALFMTASVTIGEISCLYSEKTSRSADANIASVMSQLDLSEETMVFYRLIKSVTICAVSWVFLFPDHTNRD